MVETDNFETMGYSMGPVEILKWSCPFTGYYI